VQFNKRLKHHTDTATQN